MRASEGARPRYSHHGATGRGCRNRCRLLRRCVNGNSWSTRSFAVVETPSERVDAPVAGVLTDPPDIRPQLGECSNETGELLTSALLIADTCDQSVMAERHPLQTKCRVGSAKRPGQSLPHTPTQPPRCSCGLKAHAASGLRRTGVAQGIAGARCRLSRRFEDARVLPTPRTVAVLPHRVGSRCCRGSPGSPRRVRADPGSPPRKRSE